jgi:hypothetical protein
MCNSQHLICQTLSEYLLASEDVIINTQLIGQRLTKSSLKGSVCLILQFMRLAMRDFLKFLGYKDPSL